MNKLLSLGLLVLTFSPLANALEAIPQAQTASFISASIAAMPTNMKCSGEFQSRDGVVYEMSKSSSVSVDRDLSQPKVLISQSLGDTSTLVITVSYKRDQKTVKNVTVERQDLTMVNEGTALAPDMQPEITTLKITKCH